MRQTDKKEGQASGVGGGLGASVASAAKWSVVTQLISKLISPVTTLVLAHLLAPEAFGVVALVTMVTSFADMFSDAGFQKYLIQHEYESRERFELSANVAFWTNLAVSLVLWAGIAALRDGIATMLGDPTVGTAIAVACASLPLTSAVSVQTAVYQRGFDFKTLFYSRIWSASAILLVSVPLAALGMGYWSMIAGTLASNLMLAVWLTARSTWRPSISYSFEELRGMLSFSAWTLLEAFSVWLTNWVGAFVLGSMMGSHYLGLYNTAVSLVNSVVGMVASAVNPVAFAALSRLQSDRARFDDAFYRMQKCLGLAVIPVATAMFVFSDSVVGLYLGESWTEASTLFGLYSLTSAFVVVFGYISSDAYRALGKPAFSLLGQLIFLLFMVPALVFGARSGFETLSVVVPAFRLLGGAVSNLAICGLFMKLSPWRMLSNLRWIYLATAAAAVPLFVVVRVTGAGYWVQVALAVLYFALYVGLIFAVKDLRGLMAEIVTRFGLGGALKRVPLLGRVFAKPGENK